ncbi:MAG: Tol-Pal system beta propeller repeat protein TolB [Nitrospinae bacterium]|nr:Tol-Pal system beta propeller repeat protein TolB [Nitrospinota bacterium]
MRKILWWQFVVLMVFIYGGVAYAEDEIYLEIYKRIPRKIKIAIPDFTVEKKDIDITDIPDIPEKAFNILTNDLIYSGIFDIVKGTVDRKDEKIDFKEWGILGAQALVKGRCYIDKDRVSFKLWLYNVSEENYLFGKEYSGNTEQLRMIMHTFANDIIYHLTGEEGVADTKIAFVSSSSGYKEIYIMDYDGYNIERLTNDKSIVLSPAWSPDGREIAFTSYLHKNPDLYIIQANRLNKRSISKRPGLNALPVWSPDGKRIALVLSKDGNSEIYTMNIDGKGLNRLTNHRGIDASPAWSPDGREIAFTSDRGGTPQIYIMDAEGEGKGVTRITYSGNYNDLPSWSPDGKLIVYTSRQNGCFEICVLDVRSRRSYILTGGYGEKENPTWSPDGRLIAFSLKEKGESNIYVMNADGTGQRRLTFLKGGVNYSPSWSPRLRR